MGLPPRPPGMELAVSLPCRRGLRGLTMPPGRAGQTSGIWASRLRDGLPWAPAGSPAQVQSDGQGQHLSAARMSQLSTRSPWTPAAKAAHSVVSRELSGGTTLPALHPDSAPGIRETPAGQGCGLEESLSPELPSGEHRPAITEPSDLHPTGSEKDCGLLPPDAQHPDLPGTEGPGCVAEHSLASREAGRVPHRCCGTKPTWTWTLWPEGQREGTERHCEPP